MLVGRFAKREAALVRREARVREQLPELVRLLEAAGAHRVWLFGTLAWGGFHEASDVDVAVEGLDADAQAEAWLDAERLLGVPVDVARMGGFRGASASASNAMGRDCCEPRSQRGRGASSPPRRPGR